MIYQIDFDRWIATMLPSFMRRPRLFGLLKAMCEPIKTLYHLFMLSRRQQNYRLCHNGQVCYLKAALNDAFGLSSGFDIVDADGYDGDWVYAKDISLPQQLIVTSENSKSSHPGTSAISMPLLPDEALLNTPENSFVVRVPHTLYDTQLAKVAAIVEQYRILSKTPVYSPI